MTLSVLALVVAASGSMGTVIEGTNDRADGWIRVKWDKAPAGVVHKYPWGINGEFDVVAH